MKPRARTVLWAGLTVVAWWLVSCREVPSPSGGVFSTSPLIVPSPGLVAGDTMRDSLGFAAALQVFAFNLAGDTIQTATPSFVVIDTGAHLVGALLVGDSVGRKVRIVGTVESVQTLPETVTVTLSPDTLRAADSTLHHRSFSLTSGDSVATSADLSTRVDHVSIAGGNGTLTPVEAAIVRYTIERAPQGIAGAGPTLVLVSSGNVPSTRDTTDASGKAAIRARLRLLAFTATEDTAIVNATSTYRGRTLGVVQFKVVFTSQ